MNKNFRIQMIEQLFLSNETSKENVYIVKKRDQYIDVIFVK